MKIQAVLINEDSKNYSTLEEAIKDLNNVEALTVTGINDKAAELLAEALKTNNTLKDLYLQDGELTHNGAKHLVEALKVNKTLETLDLAKNKIGDDGAKHLAEALLNHPTLTTLMLDNNNITYSGIQAISYAILENNTLKSLSLLGNKLGHNGAVALANVIASNQTLTDLNLASCEITSLQSNNIIIALSGKTNLEKVHLGNNQEINFDLLKEKLEEIKQNNPNLKIEGLETVTQAATMVPTVQTPHTQPAKTQESVVRNPATAPSQEPLIQEKSSIQDAKFKKLDVSIMVGIACVAAIAIILSAIFIAPVAIMAPVIVGILVAATLSEVIMYKKASAEAANKANPKPLPTGTLRSNSVEPTLSPVPETTNHVSSVKNQEKTTQSGRKV